MKIRVSGITVLLMTIGVLSLVHGASRLAFSDLASGAPTLCIGVAGTVQAFLMCRRSDSNV